mmetsp:Transcript_15127/g.45321  ORF Transcript_15127/g.45321 Transcript_15127/m.45321 type:complete len:400 (-) Transcript_15127:88-1287(-)|eukprot:CAMPEP_0177673574 /NCGR_PEP_ID=MMETSP0447-20121125/26032_1 /TAXON_ID=0 /ORGANISM="Stygamoeba regulata, Strain BSH-02190019" /LENGTH=399 /DNA_ID=CAMNT_0019181487 /DNA_START=39 /DNA_END=1238 /DNA_ORIENTATION=+
MGGKSSKQNMQVGSKTYSVERAMGRGAFGTVHVIIERGMSEKELDKMFALKILEKGKLVDKGERCVHFAVIERKLLSRLRHPGLVNLHCAFQDRPNCYLILDFMSGGDLSYHLDYMAKKNQSFDPETIRFYTASLLKTLAYLHSERIVHRDMKPENVMLDQRGYPHITDFNVATELDENGKASGFAGTMCYMSPEMLKKRSFDGRSDVWSVGVLMYELFTLSLPWGNRSSEETKKLLRTSHDSDSRLPSRTPDERKLCKIICKREVKKPDTIPSAAFSLMSKLLEKDPNERPTAEAAMKDPYFADFPWDQLEAETYEPCFVPREGANVSTDMVVAEAFDRAKKFKVPGDEQQKLFEEWDWRPAGFEMSEADSTQGGKKKKKKGSKKAAKEHPETEKGEE